MRRIFKAYREIIRIVFAEAPFTVAATFACVAVNGLLTPLGIYVNRNVFDGGLAVARGEMAFSGYSPYLALFAVVAILPSIMEGYIFSYVQPRSLLILRTAYKARMLGKLRTMKYEHFEAEASAEVIDKAYNRAENSARHMWPMYVYWRGAALIASLGTLWLVFNIRWWMLLTVLAPFFLETYISSRTNYNIYDELETYWKRERRYGTLGGYLRSRSFTEELKAYGSHDYLIDTYKDRLNGRNREYERYYFKHIKRILLGDNITKAGSIANVVILLALFVAGQITVGTFIAMTGLMLGGMYGNLGGVAGFFKWSGFHINSYEYYDRFFGLSDEDAGTEGGMPDSFGIEFKDVWFRYPGTDRDILKGLTLKIEDGEKASIVGENGEGKSTMVKLLLGLFTPDSGEILVGGKKLGDYPLSVRARIFGPVFQDFPRYSISLRENIGIGDVGEAGNDRKVMAAAAKGRVDAFAEGLKDGYDTLLGRDFEGGVDISGGQWQRVAIARAFMGGKPIMLLDEPTSQLDPMAEASLYGEFAEMVEGRTAVFITHRLGSTMITDRIFVIHGGTVRESGTHDDLMASGGIYSAMFGAQRAWYRQGGEGVGGDA